MNSHIYFNTKEATNLFNNNPCDSNFLLQQNLSDNVEFFRVSLNQMSFPNIVYPINSLNNTLNFCENGNTAVVFSCTLSPGSYDGFQLANEIQTKMNTTLGIGNTYVVSYSSITKKLSFTSTILGTSSSLRASSTCLYELGFTPGQDTSFITGYSSTNPVSLSGLRFIDVQVSFGTGSYATNNKSNILARVYMEYPFGSINSYRKYVDEDYCVVSAEDLTFIEIRVFDQDGRLVVLPSNQFITYDFIIKPLL